MPLHDYLCKSCDRTQLDVLTKHSDPESPKCPHCGTPMQRKVCAPRPVLFREGFYEHIAPEPIYVKSRRELKRVCAEHNCTSDYAEL